MPVYHRAEDRRSRVRVLISIPCYWPAVAYGGPVQKTRGLVAGLAGLGVESTVLTSNLLDLSRRLSHGTVRRTVDGLEVVYLHALVRYRWNPICPSALSWARRLTRSHDMVHVMGYRDTIGLAAAYAARRADVPIVFEPLGMLERSGRSATLKQIFDASLGWHLVEWAESVIATSSLEAESLARAGVPARKLVVRPNGVSSAKASRRGLFRRTLGIKPKELLVLCLGRISRQKGLPYVAAAVARVPGAHLVIAGADDADGGREDVLSAARFSGLTGRLHLPGVLDETEKSRALSDADALVLASSGESFGNAAAEGVAAGVPVLVTDRCGVAEFIERAALVVPYEPDAIAKGVRTVLTDESVRTRILASGRAVTESLGWDRVAARQVEIYRSAAEGRNGA